MLDLGIAAAGLRGARGLHFRTLPDLLERQFRFAASTPKSCPARALEKLFDNVEAKRLLTFKHADSLVHVVVAVRNQARIKMRAALLREGMVVAMDILNDAGLLLVRSGTRLTETSASRLARAIPTREVELSDPV